MVKILRIASFLLAAVAACGVIVFVVLGLRGDPGSRAFLEQKGVIEQLKNQTQVTAQKKDTVSPLVTQAKAFALRIDPPPPPLPILPPPPPPGTKNTEVSRPVVAAPPRPVSVSYELIATAHYKDNPERSLALLKFVSGPAKWLRQGEKAGHLEIHEIRDGSVVLYQDGKQNSEIFIPASKSPYKPLLKTDADAWVKAGGSVSVTTAMQPGTIAATEAPTPETAGAAVEIGVPDKNRIVRSVMRRPPTRTVDVSSRVRQVVTPTPTPAPVSEPTPAERKESVQQSITSIEGMMNSSNPETSPEDQKVEKEAWTELLKALQQEKATLESQGAADSGTKTEPNAAKSK